MPSKHPSRCARVRTATAAIALTLAGCGGGAPESEQSQPQSARRPFGESDLLIAQSLYDGRQRTPTGFYVDLPASGSRYVATAHLKSTDVDPWQFTRHNNSGNVVLDSAGVATGSGLAHSIVIATLSRGGVTAGCDRIDVVAWRHDLATVSGRLTLSIESLWSFGAYETGGVAQLCDSGS